MKSSGLPQDPPLVSIVIPTYNSSGTLAICLESIAGQTYYRKEVLIIDGDSKDDTLAIVKNFAARYPFIHFKSESDDGIYDAMNKGAKLAEGEWLIFLGADDQLHDKQVLSKIADTLSQSTADLIYGNAKLIGDASWAKDGTIYDGPFTIQKLFKKNICHQAIFYRRKLFSTIGNYNTRYKVCADWDFNFRCFAKFEVFYTDLVISKFAGGGFSTHVTVDDFNNESIFLLKKYFGIGFFDALLDPYDWIFYHHFLDNFSKANYFKAVYFWVLAVFHTEDKKGMLRVTLGRIKSRLTQKGNS